MLIDWVTARVPLDRLSLEARIVCAAIGERIIRFCPRTGSVRWETAAWDTVRSDSHQVVVRVGSDLWMQGSPARVIADGCSVFGAGASAALDLLGCVDVMRRFVQQHLATDLPQVHEWIVSRSDVTGNLELESLEEVRAALSILRNCEGGRYRVSQQAGDTVYWSHTSKHRSGKAYAKGPHLCYLMKNKTYTGRHYYPGEIQQASRLLRLELKLGREWFHRHDWKTADAATLTHEWENYFARMIGGVEMQTDANILQRLQAVATTEGRARAAYGCWLIIKSEGWERARSAHARTSWHRHLRLLRAAGFGDADISAGRVVQMRRKVMEARLVRSWAELKRAA